MTIASKSGGLILKDNRLATNCKCCASASNLLCPTNSVLMGLLEQQLYQGTFQASFTGQASEFYPAVNSGTMTLQLNNNRTPPKYGPSDIVMRAGPVDLNARSLIDSTRLYATVEITVGALATSNAAWTFTITFRNSSALSGNSVGGIGLDFRCADSNFPFRPLTFRHYYNSALDGILYLLDGNTCNNIGYGYNTRYLVNTAAAQGQCHINIGDGQGNPIVPLTVVAKGPFYQPFTATFTIPDTTFYA